MMNETFWLSVSLIVILLLGYKPVKAFVQKFLDTKISQAQALLKDAEKAYKDAQSYLKKMEANLGTQIQTNKQALKQAKSQLAALASESERKIALEIKRQLEIAEMKRSIDEDMLKKEIISEVLTNNVEKIVSELEKNNSKDIDYINSSLGKLSKGRLS